jgi:Acetyltransferase (GNAT) family
MLIRNAVADDWPRIWPIMRTVVAAGDTYCWPVDTTEGAAREWWTGKPGGRVFVAEKDGEVLGTAELHPNQPAGGSHVANAGFMVAPEACRSRCGPCSREPCHRTCRSRRIPSNAVQCRHRDE